MTKFKVKMTQEQANYLQKLGIEVDAKAFLIDRMLANHTQDTDTSMFESAPFKHFMKEFENAHMSFELAKEEFRREWLDKAVKEKTGLENVQYNWMINDYSSLECEVTLL